MKAYHDRLTNVTWSADSEATDHAASRAAELSPRRSWRAQDADAEYTLTATFDAATLVEGLLLQGCNAATVGVSLDGGAETEYTPQVDGINRWRLHVPIGASVTTIALTMKGTPQDGADYYEVGTAHPFGSVVDLPVTWDYGLTATPVAGRRRRELASRRAYSYEVGLPFVRYTGRFTQEGSEDAEQLMRLAQEEIVGMFFEVGPNREEAVPVRFNEEQYTRGYPNYDQRVVDVTLEEAIG